MASDRSISHPLNEKNAKNVQRFLVLQNLEKISKKPLLQPPLLVAEVFTNILTDVPYNYKKLGE
jgi:hypothetical protein